MKVVKLKHNVIGVTLVTKYSLMINVIKSDFLRLQQNMHSEYPNFSQGNSWYLPDVASHVTVLQPQEFRHAASDTLSTFRNFLEIVNETWFHRVKLIFRILCFCLGPGNIWRFQHQSMVHGNATYIYIYSFYILCFGPALLVFEINLSQYFQKGFAKLFTLSPIMEGITLSITCYCIMANVVFSLLTVYFIMYIVSSFYITTPHSVCSEYLKQINCHRNTTNIRYTPQFLYFYHYVERVEDVLTVETYNWKNACLTLCVWFLVGASILFILLRHKAIGIALSFCIFIVLLYTAIISATLDGASSGISKMFIPRKQDVTILKTWVYTIEQTLVTIGVGAGPLTTIWSRSKIKHWSHFDCVLVNILAFVCSLLSGIIFYSAAGVASQKYNITLIDLMDKKNPEVNTFVLIPAMFNELNSGLSNFTIFVYYLILTGSAFYALLEYTTIIFLYISSYKTVREGRSNLILSVCLVLCVVCVLLGITKFGYFFLRSVNEEFIGSSQVIILCFEMIAVSWFYGVYDFCDDIEFTLGFAPNLYFRLTWTCLPALLFMYGVSSVYLKIAYSSSIYDKLSICLIFLLTLLPIIAFAIFKCVTSVKVVGFKGIINPRTADEREMDLFSFSTNEIPDLSRAVPLQSITNV